MDSPNRMLFGPRESTNTEENPLPMPRDRVQVRRTPEAEVRIRERLGQQYEDELAAEIAGVRDSLRNSLTFTGDRLNRLAADWTARGAPDRLRSRLRELQAQQADIADPTRVLGRLSALYQGSIAGMDRNPMLAEIGP